MDYLGNMGEPIITIISRHSADCKYAGDESRNGCGCRKSLRWFQNGKQFRRTTGTRSLERAEECKRTLADQLAGREPATAGQTGQTIRAAYDSFLTAKAVKDISIDSQSKYKREILRLIQFCALRGVYTVEGISLPLLNDYKATWPEAYPSSATRSLVQQLIRGFLNYCHANGWLTRVPKLDAVRIDQPQTLPLSGAEYARLLTAAEGRTRAIILLMRWSGLAVRDAACLRTDAVQAAGKGWYRVVTSRQKSDVPVQVMVRADIIKAIQAEADKGEYLFWNPKISTAVNFARERGRDIAQAFDRAKIQSKGHMVAHRLRDSFVEYLLSQDVPLADVSKLVGHTSITTTEKHYGAWVPSRQKRLDELVKAASKKSTRK